MAISINSTGTSALTTATSLVTVMINVDASGVDRALFVHAGGIGAISSTTGVTGLTYGSQNMTRIRRVAAVGGGDDCFSELWFLVNPSGGNNTCVAVMNGAVSSMVYGICFNGVDQLSPVDATGGITGAGVIMTGAFSTIRPNAWSLNGLAFNGDHASGVAGVFIDTGTVSGIANWVEEVDVALNVSSGGFAVARNGPILTSQEQTATWNGLPGVRAAQTFASIKPSVSEAGGSREFNGRNDNVNCGLTNDVLTENGALTISAWILPFDDGESAQGRIVSREVSPTSGLGFRMTATNTLRFFVWGGTTLVHTASNSAVTLDVWQHVLVTWDGSTTAANSRIYVNGVEQTYQTTTNGVTLADNVAASVRIGNDDVNSSTFRGKIAQVEIFDRVLGLEEIRSLSKKPSSVINGRRRYYPLLGSASPEPDLAGIAGPIANGVLSGTVPSSGPPIGPSFRKPRRNYYFSVPGPSVVSEGGSLGSRIFNGTSDVITVKSIQAIDSFQVYSASCWIKIRTMPSSSTGTILAKKDAALNGWQFYVDTSNNRIGLSVGFAGTDGVFTTGNNSITAGSWHHVAFAYDTTDLLSAPQIYINGVAQTIGVTLPTVGVLDDSGVPFTIGSHNSGNFLNASICRVEYFGRLLTRGEIVQCMFLPGSITDHAVYLPILGTSSPEPDLSRHKNNGVLTGTNQYSGAPVARQQRRNRRGGGIYLQAKSATAYAVDLVLSMTLSNVLSKDILKVISQALTLSETKALEVLKSMAQSITFTETPKKDFLKVLSQAATLTETISHQRVLDLSQVLTMTETQAKDYLKVIAQTMSITESQRFLRTLDLILTMAYSDALSKNMLKVIVQALLVSESSEFKRLANFSDSITLTESIKKETLKYFTEALSVTNITTKDYLKVILQALSLTETSAVDVLRFLFLSDSITLTESMKKDYTKVVSQLTTLTESLDKNFTKSLTDSMVVSESFSKDYLKVLSQIVSLTESQTKDILKTLNDSITLTESQYKDILKVVTDTLTVTESSVNDLTSQVLTAVLLTFLLRGMIETHDKIGMTSDLTSTGTRKGDSDWEENMLVSTATLSKDSDEAERDTDRISWDFHSQ